jgi:hypothetical protein
MGTERLTSSCGRASDKDWTDSENIVMVMISYFFAILMATGLVLTSGPEITSSDLTLQLSADNASLRVGERPIVHVVVTNIGDHTVTLVQPGDGSENGWRTPVIAWSVIEESSGAKHPVAPMPDAGSRMCGNINALRPKEVFDLARGETKELKDWISLAPFKMRGVYRVVFLYANRLLLEWKAIPLGEHDRTAMGLIRRSTEATLLSNELVFSVKL